MSGLWGKVDYEDSVGGWVYAIGRSGKDFLIRRQRVETWKRHGGEACRILEEKHSRERHVQRPWGMSMVGGQRVRYRTLWALVKDWDLPWVRWSLRRWVIGPDFIWMDHSGCYVCTVAGARMGADAPVRRMLWSARWDKAVLGQSVSPGSGRSGWILFIL